MSSTKKVIITDLAGDLEWYAYRYGYNEVKFVFTQNGSPFDLTDYKFSFVVRELGTDRTLFQAEEGEGVINGQDSGILTIFFDENDAAQYLKRQDKFFFELPFVFDNKKFRFGEGHLYLQKERNKSTANKTLAMPTMDMSGPIVSVNVFAFGAAIDFSALGPSALQNLLDAILSNMTDEQKAEMWSKLAPYSLGL